MLGVDKSLPTFFMRISNRKITGIFRLASGIEKCSQNNYAQTLLCQITHRTTESCTRANRWCFITTPTKPLHEFFIILWAN